MKCPGCGAENREGSNFCRLCATPLISQDPGRTSGYIPSVPPPPVDEPYSEPYGQGYRPTGFQTPPQPPAVKPVGGLQCPRCGSYNILKGTTPVWAIVAAVAGFLVVLCFSLLFLLVKDPHKCLNCGLEFKT
jgi:hypothetical protein